MKDSIDKYNNIVFLVSGDGGGDVQVVSLPMEVLKYIIITKNTYLFIPFGYGTSIGWVHIRYINDTIFNVKQANSLYLYGIYAY